MTSQPGLQTIAVQTLSNISQIKGNQTIKLGQLVDYKKINIFPQKLYVIRGRKTSYRPFCIF